MARTSAEILDYYDEEVVKMISEKYGYDQMEALRQFLVSETYHMCEDAELEMWQFGPLAIFEMWVEFQLQGGFWEPAQNH